MVVEDTAAMIEYLKADKAASDGTKKSIGLRIGAQHGYPLPDRDMFHRQIQPYTKK